jgi:hypothetical protein
MRGRKKNPERERKDHGLFLRMTKTEMQELELASYTIEESKSEIIRKALKMYISAIKNRF